MIEYDIKEVSNLLGVSVYTIRRRIKDGSLIAYKKFGKYMVSENSLNEYIRSLELDLESVEFFNVLGNLKSEYIGKELELVSMEEFRVELNKLVTSGKKYNIDSDLARMYYDIRNRKDEC